MYIIQQVTKKYHTTQLNKNTRKKVQKAYW